VSECSGEAHIGRSPIGIWVGALGGKLPEGLAAYHGRLRSRPAYARAHARCEEKERTP
jgi:hypothetical protein